VVQAVLHVGLCWFELVVVLGGAAVPFDDAQTPHRRHISAASLIPCGVLTVYGMFRTTLIEKNWINELITVYSGVNMLMASHV